MEFESVIGLETHVQLKTQSKMFCSCAADYQTADPNTRVCPVCMGMPGVLPVINRRAIEFTIMAGLALNCDIAQTTKFDRKNYGYPDLMKGYQISQFDLPLSEGGSLEIEVNGKSRCVGITRVHVEEDAGKLVYMGAMGTADAGFVDLNRAGVPLIEIVSEPDLRSPAEAGVFLRKLRNILRYLEVCDGNMEQGSLRCDANVSVRPTGTSHLGVKAELKNMNSFRFVERALDYEIRRQIDVLEEGGRVIQETRLWEEAKNETMSMRGKEEAHDYRYFPDPDLVPVEVDRNWVDEIQNELPELPDQKENRFVEGYGLPKEDARILTATVELADYFEKTSQQFPEPKKVSNWILTELLRERKKDEGEKEPYIVVPPEHLAKMLSMIQEGVISGKIGKQVLEEMVQTGKDPQTVVKEKGLVQIQDSSELERIIEEVVENNPGEAQKFREGKEKVFGFLMGQVMKATRGKANPKLANEILRNRLKET